MTTQIINESKKKGFTVTEFYAGNGKLKYQIMQKYADIGYEDTKGEDGLRHSMAFIQLSKRDLEFILKQIEKEEEKCKVKKKQKK